MMRTPRRGFTLLEILISLSLTLVLLSGVWAMFGIFAALESRGQQQTARARLTRGLYLQLNDDIRQATSQKRREPKFSLRSAPSSFGVSDGSIDESADTGIPSFQRSASNSLSSTFASDQSAQPPEYATLVGESSWLILDLPVPAGDEDSSAASLLGIRSPNGRSALTTNNNNSAALDSATWTAPEVRYRVVYHFVAPEDLLSQSPAGSIGNQVDQRQLVVGLTRWQIHWRAGRLTDVVEELNNRKWGTSGSLVWLQPPSAGAGSALSFVNSNVPQVDREEIPELRRILFRYYHEKTGWRSSWNSTSTNRDSSGRLPSAVQMRMLWRSTKDTGGENGVDALGQPLVDQFPFTERSGRRRLAEVDENKLLAEWDLGVGTGNSAGSAPGFSSSSASSMTPPPEGYAEYLFVLPAATGPIETWLDEGGMP